MCYDRVNACRVVLMLPKDTVANSVVLRDPATDLRGSILDAERLGGRPGGPVACRVRLGKEVVPDGCEEPDTLAILGKIWTVMFPKTFVFPVPLGEGGRQ